METQTNHTSTWSDVGQHEYPAPWAGYSDRPQEMPLAGYTVLMGVYFAVFGSLLGSGAKAGRLPPRVDPVDVLLLGVATHKLGRIVTKDWVTSPLRAPFTQYEKSAGGGEVIERSRGEGLRRATGDLLTCPWCIAPWVAGGLYTAFVMNPPLARLVAGVFASVAVSDLLQHLYGAVKSMAK